MKSLFIRTLAVMIFCLSTGIFIGYMIWSKKAVEKSNYPYLTEWIEKLPVGTHFYVTSTEFEHDYDDFKCGIAAQMYDECTALRITIVLVGPEFKDGDYKKTAQGFKKIP